MKATNTSEHQVQLEFDARLVELQMLFWEHTGNIELSYSVYNLLFTELKNLDAVNGLKIADKFEKMILRFIEAGDSGELNEQKMLEGSIGEVRPL